MLLTDNRHRKTCIVILSMCSKYASELYTYKHTHLVIGSILQFVVHPWTFYNIIYTLNMSRVQIRVIAKITFIYNRFDHDFESDAQIKCL